MKSISEQALNQINIVGKLLDVTYRNGTLSDGRIYESANMTIRVTQTYGGQEEVSEIPVSMFAAKYTLNNKLNPGYDQIQALKEMKSAQNVGIDAADTVRISRANIRENNFVGRNGTLVSNWQINTSFIGKGSATDSATFNLDIFIMDMHPEETRDGDPTGRLVIKGGVVQYNGNLDVLEFIVEQPEAVEFIERNWNQNDTVNARGRVRVAVNEEKSSGASSSWGEDIPEATTRTVKELIITTGSDSGKEEDFAYDPVEIKKAFNARKAKIEQMQLDAANKQAAKPATSKYNWE